MSLSKVDQLTGGFSMKTSFQQFETGLETHPSPNQRENGGNPQRNGDSAISEKGLGFQRPFQFPYSPCLKIRDTKNAGPASPGPERQKFPQQKSLDVPLDWRHLETTSTTFGASNNLKLVWRPAQPKGKWKVSIRDSKWLWVKIKQLGDRC